MAKKRMLEDRGALPEEDGHKLRSCGCVRNVEGVKAEMESVEGGRQTRRKQKWEKRGGEQGKGGDQKEVLEVGVQ